MLFRSLHDRCLLPHFLWNDLGHVLTSLQQAGFNFEPQWFAPHFDFRCPPIGEFRTAGLHIRLRQALEPWYVLGEEPGSGGTTRYVDSSVERLQLHVTGLHAQNLEIAVNGVRVPLTATDTPGEFIAGVRYRAWAPPSCLHPTIGLHVPLTVDVFDTAAGRSLGGCRYHVDHPGGLNPEGFPVNALAAESRRAARFFRMGHTPSHFRPSEPRISPDFPCTLDLRRQNTH